MGKCFGLHHGRKEQQESAEPKPGARRLRSGQLALSTGLWQYLSPRAGIASALTNFTIKA
jgi:hypothetical protein